MVVGREQRGGGGWREGGGENQREKLIPREIFLGSLGGKISGPHHHQEQHTAWALMAWYRSAGAPLTGVNSSHGIHSGRDEGKIVFERGAPRWAKIQKSTTIIHLRAYVFSCIFDEFTFHDTHTTLSKILAHKEISRKCNHIGPNPALFDAKVIKWIENARSHKMFSWLHGLNTLKDF